MSNSTMTFTFDRSVPMADVESTLRLAYVAAECLHGEDRIHLETDVTLSRSKRRCEIDTRTDVGRTLALLFAGYVRREFGDDMVHVDRVESGQGHLVGAT